MELYLSDMFFDLAENGFVSRLPSYRVSHDRDTAS